MANKVEIIVVAKDMTGPVFDEVERKAKSSGEKAGKDAGDGIKKGIEDSIKDTDGIGDKLSTEFEKAGKDAGDKFSTSLGDSLKGKEFGVDFRGVGVNIGTQIGDGVDEGLGKSGGNDGGGKSLLSRITGAVGDAAKAGTEIGNKVIGGIAESFKGSGGQLGEALKTGLIAGLVVSAVVLAPLIASMAAGIIAGAGVLTAAIGGVIAVAVTSPEVQAAGSQLGQTLLNGLKVSTEPLVQPVLQAIDSIQQRFAELRPTLDNIFGNTAELIAPLSNALQNFVVDVTAGLDTLIEKAGPEVMSGISTGINDLGEAFRYMFERFAEVPELGQGIEATFLIISEAIVDITDVLATGAEAWGEFVERWGAIRDIFEADGLSEKIGEVAEAIKLLLFDEAPDEEGVVGQFVHLKDSADAASESVKTMSETLQAFADQQLAMIDPLAAYNKAVDDVAKKQEKFNEAVAKHGPLSQEAQSAGVLLEQAILRQADAAAKAQGAFAEWTPEMQAAAEAANLTDGQIAALRATVEQTTQSAEAFAKDWVATIDAKNAEESQRAVEAFKAAIDALPNSKTVTVNVVATGAVGLAGLRTGGNVGGFGAVGRAASGGNRGNMTLVGEEGPELVRLPFGSSVMPTGQTKRVLKEQTATDRAVNSEGETPRWDGTRELLNAVLSLGDRIERMQLVIDGRVLGAVQGRDSDLLYRAG